MSCKNGFVRVRLLNYVIDTDITHTKLKVWTRQRSVSHKMWGYVISFAINLDGKVDSVGYFEMYGSLQFCAPIFENRKFSGKSHQRKPSFKPTGRGHKFKCGAKSAGSASTT